MRLLLINGNTTEAVTDKVVAEARRIAAPGTEIVGVTATFGANIVTREAENVIASFAVLDLLARHQAGFDAAILAISFDSALEAACQISPIPVLGMSESALLAASEKADRLGIILFGGISRPLYEDLFARSSVRDKIVDIRVIEIASVSAYLEREGQEAAVLAAVEDMARSGVEAVVICGAAMAGIAERLQPCAMLPLFDGIPCAVRRAEELVAAGTHTGSSAPPMPSVLVSGVGAELAQLMNPRSQP